MRRIRLSVLPGQSDEVVRSGGGRQCIHLFVPSDTGPFVESHAMHVGDDQRIEVRPTRGRLACDSKRSAAPATRGGTTQITQRTNDPRAVTCLKCIATSEWRDMTDRIPKQE